MNYPLNHVYIVLPFVPELISFNHLLLYEHMETCRGV